MERVANWDHRLLEWQLGVLGEPFVWGETDCGILVREAAEVMYGEDLFPDAPSWTTKTGALRAHRKTSVVEELRELGAKELPITFAWDGDVAVNLAEDAEIPDAAVVVDGALLVADPEEGVTRVPLRAAGRDLTVWRIP